MTTMTAMLTDLHHTVSAWEGVESMPHRFGGTEYHVGKVEIGHVHRNGMVDIPFTRALREVLVREGGVEPHHFLPESGWISFYIRAQADGERAARLFRLSYLQKVGRRGKLTAEAVRAELDRLEFSDSIRALITPSADQ